MSGEPDAALRTLDVDDLITHSLTYDDPIASSEDLPDLLQYHRVSFASTLILCIEHLKDLFGYARSLLCRSYRQLASSRALHDMRLT